jgi:uncharacterized membrane protein
MTPVEGTEAMLSRRQTVVLRLLVLATVLSAVLVVGRMIATGSTDAANLVWNLFLAWIPFVLAVLVHDSHRRGGSRAPLLAGGALWLLFLPNAPYILTDFRYLRVWEGVPRWYDVLLLSAAAGTGLALGFASLYLMQTLARRALPPLESRLFVVVVLGLTSLGVYVGRSARWNSWDVFSEPASLLSDLGEWLSDPLQHGRAFAAVVLFAAFLTLAYGAFCRLVDRAFSDHRD